MDLPALKASHRVLSFVLPLAVMCNSSYGMKCLKSFQLLSSNFAVTVSETETLPPLVR